jgi:hypothetical protein
MSKSLLISHEDHLDDGKHLEEQAPVRTSRTAWWLNLVLFTSIGIPAADTPLCCSHLWLLQTLLISAWVVYTLQGSDSLALMQVVLNLALVAELVVNSSFGSWYSKSNRIEDTLQWVVRFSNLSARQERYLRYTLDRTILLAWAGWLVSVMVIVVTTYEWVDKGKMDIQPIWHTACQAWSIGIIWGQGTYLCVLWVWLNYTMRQAVWYLLGTIDGADHRIYDVPIETYSNLVESSSNGRSVDEEQVCEYDRLLSIERKLHELLQRMQLISRDWAFNHATRLVTTTLMATCNLALYEMDKNDTHLSKKGHQTWQNYFLGCSVMMYALVWCAAAIPGLVSDLLFKNVLRRLGKLAAGIELQPCLSLRYTGTDQAQGRQPGIGRASGANVRSVLRTVDVLHTTNGEHDGFQRQQQITSLMQRVQCLWGLEGMKFAFVPMTTARAGTAGTLLGYLIVGASRAFGGNDLS